MEQLEKPLGRARQPREALPRLTGDRKNQGPACAPTKPIHYTKTRVVKPNQRVLARNRIITSSAAPGAVAHYKVLRTRVLQRMTANAWRSLAVTSPGEHEGKTVTAVNLAISLAREMNFTVVLVDLDLRHPSVHRYLGLEATRGVVDYLLDDVPLCDILCNPSIDGLCIVPGRDSVENSSELLSSPRMAQLVKELTFRYHSRIVLFDLPPALFADDVMTFLPNVDAVLLTIEDGKTTREDVLRSLQAFGTTPVLGTVLNNSQEKSSRYEVKKS